MFKSMKIWKLFTFLYLFCSCQGSATEYGPWLGNFYEFELRSSLKYQGYAWLASDLHHTKYPSNDFFLNLSLSNAIPDPAISGEFEVTGARTRRQQRDIDQLKLTGRYLWQDDVAGDPYSLVTGLSYTQAFKHSLRDVSSFHHGLYNAELFVSLGQEKADECLWGSRWWGMFAIGIAEQGSPWLRLRLNYDKRWCEKHELGLFLHSLWGLGGKHLHLNDFHGYGLIKHQSIDLGVRYTYVIEYFGNASLEYSYRVYANNFPAYVHRVLAQVLYTFGL
jgi:hypothetical protein